MKNIITALALGFGLLSTHAFAQQAPQPCQRTGQPDIDQLRCELAIASQAGSQANSSLIAMSAQLALLQSDLRAAQAQIKALQDENAALKKPK